MFEVVIIVQYHISEIHRSLLGMYKMVYSGPKKKKDDGRKRKQVTIITYFCTPLAYPQSQNNTSKSEGLKNAKKRPLCRALTPNLNPAFFLFNLFGAPNPKVIAFFLIQRPQV